MIINLYISSKKCDDYNKIDILKLLNQYIVQVTSTYSNVEYKENNKIEKGFKLTFCKIDDLKELKQIWGILKPKLNLECAYVNCPTYLGCILNIPNVFTKSNCNTNC